MRRRTFINLAASTSALSVGSIFLPRALADSLPAAPQQLRLGTPAPTPTPVPRIGNYDPVFQTGPDATAYFGKPFIYGLKGIQPKFQLTVSSTIEPVVIYASASATTWTREKASDERPGEYHPWRDLEYRWTLIDNATGRPYATPKTDLLKNPVPHVNGLPNTIDPAIHQIGPEICMFIRTPGSYTLKLDVRGFNEEGEVFHASTTKYIRPSQWFFSVSLSGHRDLNEENTTGTLTMSVTIPPGSSVKSGTFSRTFDMYAYGADVKAWLESVCGAENVHFEGGTISDYHTLAYVQDYPADTPHPWPICEGLGGTHYITFIGALGALPVTLSVTNNITTLPERKFGFFVQQFPHMIGTSGTTITVNPFAGNKVYIDTNYDGSKGPSDGSIDRPLTGLTPTVTSGANNTAFYFKRGSTIRLYPDPNVDVFTVVFGWWSPIECCRWMTYGNEDDPAPVFGIYGGPNYNSIIRCNLGPGHSLRDLVIDGLTFEAWNPDPAVNRGIPRTSGPQQFLDRLLGSGNGALMPSWSYGVTFSNCVFQWNVAAPAGVAWALSEGDAHSPFWTKINNEFRMARGENVLQGGGAPYQALMGNRYYGGGRDDTFFQHQLYTMFASHSLRRFELQENNGIDGLPYVGGTANKMNIYNSAEGFPTDYILMADCFIRGFTASTVIGGGTNLLNGVQTAGHSGLTIFERLHHHRPGLGGSQNNVIWFGVGWTKFHTVRDSHYTRLGLNMSGGAGDMSWDTPKPGSFTHFYRNRVHGAPNNSADNKAGFFASFGTPGGDGAYVAYNLFVKQTNLNVGIISVWTAAIPNMRMHHNVYYSNHPQQFLAKNLERSYYTVEQLQAMGLELSSSVPSIDDFKPVDFGTDERTTILWMAKS